MEKYCDLNPTLGETSAYYNIVGSLLSSGLLRDLKVFHYDEYLVNTGNRIDQHIIDQLREDKPDCLAVSYYPFADSRNVASETFEQIKQMGVPVVFIWFDYIHKHIRDLAQSIGSCGSLNVVVDTFDHTGGKFMPMWVPQDERIFKQEGTTKDIEICFNGSMNGYGERHTYINYLKNHLSIHIDGGQREHRLTLQQYAEVLKRSKISLNFPNKPDGSVQGKCRIYESMLCGCLLMEKANPVIERWFAPSIDYIPFSSEGELVDRAKYYLANNTEREKIVSSATKKMRENYSSKNWWKIVIEEARKNLN